MLPSLRSAILCALWTLPSLQAAELSIRSDYPGGNLIVESIDGATARIGPDLGTRTRDWFYWNFEATSGQAGPVQFIFKGPKIGVRGPAVSLDDGHTWKWLGKEAVTYSVPKENPDESFVYHFTETGQKVRFAVSFPYVQGNLEEFLKKNASNPNLSTSVLTKSTGGRPVELLQIGKPGEGITPMLVAARSHACEALASYVLEGFLEEALSDSPAGFAFRKKYVLYAVPFLDKDGVEKGEQGKGREPHDHNRDYGSAPIYPEVAALMKLAADKKVRVAIDFHCPYLRGDIHEAYHWLGIKVPHVADNITELNTWLADERPRSANAAISFLTSPEKATGTENIPFSWYFSRQPDNLIGVTLESPYAQAETVEDARNYGRGLLRALTRTELTGPDANNERGAGSYADFAKFRKTMSSLAGKPADALAAAAEYLDHPAASSLYRAQADLGLAEVMKRQKKFPEALEYAHAALAEPGATASQKVDAMVAVAGILAASDDTQPAAMEAAIQSIEAFPFAAPADRADAYKAADAYYASTQNLGKALEYTRKRRKTCRAWEESGALLREAEILDAMHNGKEANERRKEVVALLKPQLLPTPKGKSIFMGTMTGDYFDAVTLLPDSTKEEKMEAAQVVLKFPVLPGGLKERVERWIANQPE